MAKENETTSVTKKDLQFIKKELLKEQTAPPLHELATKLAFEKNASQLNQAVKQYNPDCTYEPGDLICKDYDEQLTVSSKGTEAFKGKVVLKVINKKSYESYNCEMLEVDYTGGSIFRKYIDYMKKTNTQVMLPCSQGGKAQAPEILKKEEDPRLHELPMTKKDLKALEKNLKKALSKSDDFFHWNDLWQLTEKQIKIPETIIKKIEKSLKKTKESAATTDLVSEFIGISPSHADFHLHCLSLNHFLEKKYKKSFIFVNPIGWGKWILRDTLKSFVQEVPLSAPQAKLPKFDSETKLDLLKQQESPLKIYLTWREILSGGIKIPANLSNSLSSSREYIFTDSECGKQYKVYFYPKTSLFIGLQEFYKQHNVTQGASLTLTQKDIINFSFGLKEAKQAMSAPMVKYDFKKDIFTSAKEISTSALPNKILHLRNDTLKKLFSLYDQREKLDLRELLVIIFKTFGLKGKTLSLHVQRAYHLVDILKHTTLENIKMTLLLSPEFAVSGKKEDLFFYQEKIKKSEEIDYEEPIEVPGTVKAESSIQEIEEELPEIGTVGEVETPTVVLKEKPPEKSIEKEKPPKKPKKEKKPTQKTKEELPPEPRKEKKPKKKRHKPTPEEDKGPRQKKGKKRIIEEQIELEESEMEALFAVKADKKQEIEEIKTIQEPKKKEEYVSQEQTDQALSGIFGAKLKSALVQKDGKKQETPPKPTGTKTTKGTKKPAKKTTPTKTKAKTKTTKSKTKKK